MRAAADPLQLKLEGVPKRNFWYALPVCQKSLAEFAARRRQRNEIIFSRDMCVRENTSRAASVEFVRHRRANYARSRPQAFCRKNPEGFSTVLEGVPRRIFRYALRRSGKTPLFFMCAFSSAATGSCRRCSCPRRCEDPRFRRKKRSALRAFAE